MADYGGTVDLHIVVTGDALILSRGANATASDFQAQYPGFVRSLRPMDGDTLLDTFEYEWPDVLVINQSSMKDFITGKGKDARTDFSMDIRGASQSVGEMKR